MYFTDALRTLYRCWVFVIVCFHSNGWLILCLFLTHCLHELECWCFHFPVRNLINVKIMSSILGQEPMKPQINVSPSAILCLDHPSHYYQEQTPHHWDPWETTYIQKNIPWNVKFFGCSYPASWWHGSLLPTVTEPDSLWCLAWEMGGIYLLLQGEDRAESALCYSRSIVLFLLGLSR